MNRFLLGLVALLLFTNSSRIQDSNPYVSVGSKVNYDFTDIRLKPINPWFDESELSPLSTGEGKGVRLHEALNPDGTLKPGFEGSFDPTGYTMSYGFNGEPIFSPVPLGAGDERWEGLTKFNGLNGTVRANDTLFIILFFQ